MDKNSTCQSFSLPSSEGEFIILQYSIELLLYRKPFQRLPLWYPGRIGRTFRLTLSMYCTLKPYGKNPGRPAPVCNYPYWWRQRNSAAIGTKIYSQPGDAVEL